MRDREKYHEDMKWGGNSNRIIHLFGLGRNHCLGMNPSRESVRSVCNRHGQLGYYA